jgi:hypothetical protein
MSEQSSKAIVLPRCDGRCVMGPDVLPGSDPTLVAYPNPDCPAHGWSEPPEDPDENGRSTDA